MGNTASESENKNVKPEAAVVGGRGRSQRKGRGRSQRKGRGRSHSISQRKSRGRGRSHRSH